MVICEFCGQEERGSDTCVKRFERQLPFGGELDDWTFGDSASGCGGCGGAVGGFHHPGCEVERCPKCHGQLITCDCETSESVRLL